MKFFDENIRSKSDIILRLVLIFYFVLKPRLAIHISCLYKMFFVY